MELSKTRKHVGEKFGELEILEQYSDNRKTKVLCKCNRCGETTIKRYDYIKDKRLWLFKINEQVQKLR